MNPCCRRGPGSIGGAPEGWAPSEAADRRWAVIGGGDSPRGSVDSGLAQQPRAGSLDPRAQSRAPSTPRPESLSAQDPVRAVRPPPAAQTKLPRLYATTGAGLGRRAAGHGGARRSRRRRRRQRSACEARWRAFSRVERSTPQWNVATTTSARAAPARTPATMNRRGERRTRAAEGRRRRSGRSRRSRRTRPAGRGD